jgi:hypothetical protein
LAGKQVDAWLARSVAHPPLPAGETRKELIMRALSFGRLAGVPFSRIVAVIELDPNREGEHPCASSD